MLGYEIATTAIRGNSASARLHMKFSVLATTGYCLRGELELLLIPKILIAGVGTRAPLRAHGAFPVPLGVMSFDLDIVSRQEAFLQKRLPSRSETESSTKHLVGVNVGVGTVPWHGGHLHGKAILSPVSLLSRITLYGGRIGAH